MHNTHWQIGKIWGIPLSMHWSVLLWCVLFFATFGFTFVDVMMASVALIVLMLVHELGHVIALRAKRLDVDSIELAGLHGITDTAYIPYPYEIVVGWSGVAAQLVLYGLTELVLNTTDLMRLPYASSWLAPVALVWTRYNLILMLAALIPIGPFDGNRAWRVFGWMRSQWRRLRRARRLKDTMPEPQLSEEEQHRLEELSSRMTSELLERLTKRPHDRSEDH